MRVPSRSSWPRWARASTSAWVLSPLIVLTLLVATFVGYGAWTRSRPTTYARGGEVFAATNPAASSSAGPVSRRPGKKPAAAARRTAGPRAIATPATSANSSRGGRTGQSVQGGHASASPTPSDAGVVAPATGSYTLSVSGSEHVKFGPFSACANTFPSQASLVVHRAAGEPTGSYDFDQRFYPDSPNKHDERHIYRYSPDSVVLSYEEATVTCAGVKQSTTVSFSPAQLRVQLPLRVGASWKNHGGDSSRTEDGTSTVVSTQTLTVNGQSYLTYVIDTHLTMSGSEHGTRDQRWWWAPALGVPLQWHESLSGNRSGATYSEDVTCTVVSKP